MQTIDEATERMRLLMLDAAKAESEAKRLDERRKIIRSQLVAKFRADGKAIGESEHLAMASESYSKAVDEAFAADLEASVKSAEAEAAKIRWETWRTRQANKRAEMKL